MVVLCKGSIASKIKFGMKIFSSTDTKEHTKIKRGEFSTFLHFVFRLSLEAGNEIMLDYPLDKLASEVATACWKFNEIEDLQSWTPVKDGCDKGTSSLECPTGSKKLNIDFFTTPCVFFSSKKGWKTAKTWRPR